MNSPIKNIRISHTARDQLIRLKRFTGVTQWNVLCRWAFCRSMAEPSPPSPAPLGEMSNIEMSWPVFAGPMSDAFILMLKQRVHEDNLQLDEETLATQFRLHLHRGIAYLAQEGIRKVEDLAERALEGLVKQRSLPFAV